MTLRNNSYYDDDQPPLPPSFDDPPPLPLSLPGDEIAPPLPPDAIGSKKRKSRWGDESKKVNISAVHAPIPTSLNSLQLEIYLVQSRLEEIDRKLRSGDVIPGDHERSPSPPPTYDSQGKRTNMREARYKKKLEEERGRLVDVLLKINPNYKAPTDLRRSNGQLAYTEKVWIPTREFPDVNFIGLLIGPRGNELKKMERESGGKISIRGKGSAKEGKQGPMPGADEELHAYVAADSEEKVQKAVDIINKIIEEAVSMPECDNPLKKQQLKELAQLNGTFRDDQNEVCSNCGATGHRKYDCTEARNFTASLICHICGGGGHLSKDCMNRNNPEALNEGKERRQRMDTEYVSFMKHIGGSAVDSKASPPTEFSLLGPSSLTGNTPSIPKLGKPDVVQQTSPPLTTQHSFGTPTITPDYAAYYASLQQQYQAR